MTEVNSPPPQKTFMQKVATNALVLVGIVGVMVAMSAGSAYVKTPGFVCDHYKTKASEAAQNAPISRMLGLQVLYVTNITPMSDPSLNSNAYLCRATVMLNVGMTEAMWYQVSPMPGSSGGPFFGDMLVVSGFTEAAKFVVMQPR